MKIMSREKRLRKTNTSCFLPHAEQRFKHVRGEGRRGETERETRGTGKTVKNKHVTFLTKLKSHTNKTQCGKIC